MNNHTAALDIRAKHWSLCHVLRDDGVTYHQYLSELTYLLFLKMMKETGQEHRLKVWKRPKKSEPPVEQAGTRWDDLLNASAPERLAAIVEVGNHIAQLGNGAMRRAAAERFIAEMRKALADEAPWKPINFPSNQEVLSWLDAFPGAAMQGLGMGDLSIKKEWEDLCAKYRMSRVRVWTLDDDLGGLDRAVLARRRVN